MRTRMNIPGRVLRIMLPGRWVLMGLLAVALVLPCAGQAQTETTPSAESAARILAEAAADAGSAESHVAEITGNDVYIRSGPGTNFYHCGKLYQGDRVQVVKSEQGWTCIVPPPGCFSWIPMQYVSINLDNPTMGIVTGDDVKVYAGSDYVEPMHSTSKQVVLNRRAAVKLLSEEKDDYYKIAPPEGAYLWVSSQFVQSVEAPVRTKPPVEIEAPGPKPVVEATTQVDPNESSESQDPLDTYYALSKLVKAEQAKPVDEQDYTEVKKKLKALMENEAAGKAARYAEFTLKQVERFELACTVAKEIELQNKELEKVTEQIDEARSARLAQIENLGKFAVIGKLASSSVYGSGQNKRYRILDDSGKTICYVAPSGTAATTDLSGMMGKKVGVVGNIKPHEATARALVEFTQIVPIEQEQK